VNAGVFAKHFNKLTPCERFRLLLAASNRGDIEERDRLQRAASTLKYPFSDHWHLAMALQETCIMHMLQLLEMAARYFLWVRPRMTPDAQDGEQFAQVIMALRYQLKVHLAGWRLFCTELGIAPDLLWSALPGFALVEPLEKITDDADGLEAVQQLSSVCPWLKSVNADSIAADLRTSWRERAEFWGGPGTADDTWRPTENPRA
jgi:hypothetical protein